MSSSRDVSAEEIGKLNAITPVTASNARMKLHHCMPSAILLSLTPLWNASRESVAVLLSFLSCAPCVLWHKPQC